MTNTTPKPGTEAAVQQRNTILYSGGAALANLIVYLMFFRNLFNTYFGFYHAEALKKDAGSLIHINHIAGGFSVLLLIAGPVVVWLGGKDAIANKKGDWAPLAWVLYLVSLAVAIFLAAGFNFSLPENA